MDAREAIQIIKTQKFVIYGNGYIAKRLYRLIQRLGYERNVVNIVVTKAAASGIGVHGSPLHSIAEVNRDALVLLAVHNTAALEMKRTLLALGFEHFIWIYPYLFEMEMGSPIKKCQPIETDALIKRYTRSCGLTIYYLTLKDYCNENIYNGQLYIKFSSSYITTDMAEKRWKRFQRRIEQSLKNGYQQDYSIKVNEDYHLIDGAHRLVFAKYFHADTVFADIYAGHGEFYSEAGLGGDVFLHEKDLPKYYTDDEIAAIKAADRELRGSS